MNFKTPDRPLDSSTHDGAHADKKVFTFKSPSLANDKKVSDIDDIQINFSHSFFSYK